jgi:(p)ppGpp synthase/HD superfamily hydrolase
MTTHLETAADELVLLGSLKMMTTISQDIDSGVDWYGRVKTNHAVSRKMLRGSLGIHEILDIIGIRAVTEHVHDCYRLIRRIPSAFPVLASEFDDYIAAPKPNGYRSLHTTVLSPCGLPVEIQVRTQAMHVHAKSGGASHLRNKQLQAVEGSRG